MKIIILTLCAVFCVIGSAWAQSAMVGKELPAMRVDFVGSKPPEYKGKPLILEFWATWCPPCRTSIPHLNEINKNFKDKGLVIIGVTDEPNATIRQFTKDTPMDYNVATDLGGKLSKEFGITGIPRAFLVNREGKIVWEGHPMRLTDADIEAILK